MKWKNASIAVKLYSAFGIAVLLVSFEILLLLSFALELRINEAQISSVDRLRSSVFEMRHARSLVTESLRNYILTGDVFWEKRYREKSSLLVLVRESASGEASDVGTKVFFEHEDEANRMLVMLEGEAHELMREGRNNEARETIDGERYTTWGDYYEKISGEYLDQNSVLRSQIEFVSAHLWERALEAGAAFFAGSILFFLLIVRYFASAIILSLRRLETGANNLAQGKFSERVPVGSLDEIGRLAVAFNKVAVALQKGPSGTGQQLKEINTLVGEP